MRLDDGVLSFQVHPSGVSPQHPHWNEWDGPTSSSGHWSVISPCLKQSGLWEWAISIENLKARDSLSSFMVSLIGLLMKISPHFSLIPTHFPLLVQQIQSHLDSMADREITRPHRSCLCAFATNLLTHYEDQVTVLLHYCFAGFWFTSPPLWAGPLHSPLSPSSCCGHKLHLRSLLFSDYIRGCGSCQNVGYPPSALPLLTLDLTFTFGVVTRFIPWVSTRSSPTVSASVHLWRGSLEACCTGRSRGIVARWIQDD